MEQSRAGRQRARKQARGREILRIEREERRGDENERGSGERSEVIEDLDFEFW